MKIEKLQSNIKGYKTMSISSTSSISTSLHSGVASTISCSETSLSNGFKSGSLIIHNCPWFGLSCFHSLRYHWQIVIKGGAYLKIFTLAGCSFEEIR